VPLKAVLELRGQSVEAASSGSEALARIHSAARFDLILCDLNLEEVDGWAIAEEVSKIPNGPRFYLMTGRMPDLAENDPRHSLAKEILTKPIDLEHLFRILDGID
jgi:two-component system, NtrC family, response regulator GlrR